MEDYTEKRRQQLLAIYPPEKTTRADVQTRWAPLQPDLHAVRPSNGWSAFTDPAVRARVTSSEERTGQPVHRCERYFGPDGWSGGLCLCWFYYDDRDQLVDAEWQWHTD